jgi:hypothetical protein
MSEECHCWSSHDERLQVGQVMSPFAMDSSTGLKHQGVAIRSMFNDTCRSDRPAGMENLEPRKVYQILPDREAARRRRVRRGLRGPVRPVRSSETADGHCAPTQRPRSAQVSGHPRDDSASPVSKFNKDGRRRIEDDASERSERATRSERAGEAARESACRGVRGAKPLG